jgi:hypothetical protein
MLLSAQKVDLIIKDLIDQGIILLRQETSKSLCFKSSLALVNEEKLSALFGKKVSSPITYNRYVPVLLNSWKAALANESQGIVIPPYIVHFSPIEKILLYKEFFSIMNYDERYSQVSIGDPALLGNMAIRDYICKIFFLMLTTRRQASHIGLASLGITGISSCGKSLIYSSPLNMIANQVCTDSVGVGVFEMVPEKSCIVIGDILLSSFLTKSNISVLRKYCRSEYQSIKSYAKSKPVVEAFFVMLTSNERLFHLRSREGLILKRAPWQSNKAFTKEVVNSFLYRLVEIHFFKRPELSSTTHFDVEYSRQTATLAVYKILIDRFLLESKDEVITSQAKSLNPCVILIMKKLLPQYISVFNEDPSVLLDALSIKYPYKV